MLELAVLGLLAEQPLHGYELKKRLGETLGPLWGISFGSLYPALRRLEKSGAIEETEAQEPARTGFVPTGSVDGDLAAARQRRRPRPGRRTRKAYRITDRGRATFAELLTDDQTDDERTFALKLSFCRYLSREDRLALLERRRNQLSPTAHHGPPRSEPHHRPLHPVAPRAPGPFDPARPRVDRRADRRRARPDRRAHRRTAHRRSSIRMSDPTASQERTKSASRSPASATARAASCRVSSSTRTPTPTSACPGSCTSTSAATTSVTSSSSPRSTWTPRRSASTSARRSSRASTTRSSSPRCRTSA